MTSVIFRKHGDGRGLWTLGEETKNRSLDPASNLLRYSGGSQWTREDGE